VGEPVLLRSARLVLSAPGDDDVAAVFAACQDPEIARWTTVPSPYTREHAVDFVRRSAQAWDAGSENTWAMRADGELVGMIGLHRIAGGQAELGYWVSAAGRGRGYGVEAGRAVLDFAFGPLRLQRVEWHAVVGNVPSARLARSLGFRFEGTRRAGLAPQNRADGDGRRADGWLAALLPSDDRTPQPWPVLP